MRKKNLNIQLLGIVFVFMSLMLAACSQDTPPLAKEAEEPHMAALAQINEGAAIRAVDILEAWVSAGAPEEEPFTYVGIDGNKYEGEYQVDIHPLFSKNDIWFDGSQACSGCHFGNLESSYHEMDLGTYEGILKGGDVLSDIPGVPILGQSEVGVSDYDWAVSKLKERLRNNRMPPGWPFDISETNRDGPCVEVSSNGVVVLTDDNGSLQYGCELNAAGLLGGWVEAGAPESSPFSYGGENLTFKRDVQPFFSQPSMWFDGSQACSGCHFSNSENSYHEMDLGTYEGIMAGGDVLSKPPGVPILGQSEVGATDYDWGQSKLRGRLRNNRMAPEFPFDITEENRDGPYVLHGTRLEAEKNDGDEISLGTGECKINTVDLIGAWVDAGAPEVEQFGFISKNGATCEGTYEADILPLFTESSLWFEGAQACSGCHFENSENSYHEMDLVSYEGIMAGGDVLSAPPGVPILGQSEVGIIDFDWEHAKLRERLRNNRMPPGWPFDISETNRDGPCVEASGDSVIVVVDAEGNLQYGCDLNALGVLEAWVEAGAPETETFDFSSGSLVFERDVLPFFTEAGMWFVGSQACSSCHFGNNENSYHEMDLSTYEGILKGGDVLSKPPGVPILGQSEIGATDYDWGHSKLRARLRNNRMAPGFPFDITEENRDGPEIQAGAIIVPGESSEDNDEVEENGDITGPAGRQCKVKAVDLIGAWVEAGAPEAEVFDFESVDGVVCEGTYEADVLMLFTEKSLWFDGAQACSGCHFNNSENSYHEMDLITYEGIMAGGDVLSKPPGVPILGQSEVGGTDFDWAHSKLRERLRNNRMPPGWPFDITETNRDGPCVEVSEEGVIIKTDGDGKIEYGCDLNALGLLGAWIDSGAPESETFEYSGAELTFERDVLPFFTQPNMWFDGSQGCVGCHFGNNENSYHEMDLSTYAGILLGGDVLSKPPGVPILGQSEVGATDYDWAHSKLRERLRNNRMSPGIPFDITEENRDGPIVEAGHPKE